MKRTKMRRKRHEQIFMNFIAMLDLVLYLSACCLLFYYPFLSVAPILL